jgi:predicted metal-dependent enzyme (double-stranded beta helix superfamily)
MSRRGDLDTLATAVRVAVARRSGWRETARLVASELERHLPSPSILTAEQRAGDGATFRSHVLHAEPDGSFSIVALLWRPGQMTRVHDHVTWGRSPSSRARSMRSCSPSTRTAHAASRLGAR